MTDKELTELAASTVTGTDGIISMPRPVRLSGDSERPCFDIYITVEFGANIPVIAWDVQQKVKKALSEASSEKPGNINIHVQGVEKKRNK